MELLNHYLLERTVIIFPSFQEIMEVPNLRDQGLRANKPAFSNNGKIHKVRQEENLVDHIMFKLRLSKPHLVDKTREWFLNSQRMKINASKQSQRTLITCIHTLWQRMITKKRAMRAMLTVQKIQKSIMVPSTSNQPIPKVTTIFPQSQIHNVAHILSNRVLKVGMLEGRLSRGVMKNKKEMKICIKTW